jgi:hypothetical protein
MRELPEDDAARGPGRLVRPYAMTHGRTRPAKDTFDLICLVASAGPSEAAFGLEPEHVHILDLCQRPLSVAEISARLDLPVGVVRVLLDDLLERNSIVVRAPMSVARMPSKRVLKAVINGLRAL